MELNTYMYGTRDTATYPKDIALIYVMLGLVNEAGEVSGKLKKVYRGDKTLEEQKAAILAECGDVLWYLARVVDELGSNLEDVAAANLAKLQDRKARNVLKGDGDNR